MGRNQSVPRGCSPALGGCGRVGDMLEPGPTEQCQDRGKEDGVKTCVVVPDGGTRGSGTNHSLACSGASEMLQPWAGSPGVEESLSLGMALQDTAAAIPTLCQRWPRLSRNKGLCCCLMGLHSPSGSRLLPQQPSCGGRLMQRGLSSPQTGAWLWLQGHHGWQL